MESNFKEREFAEVPGGYYENNYYLTPNGSKTNTNIGFWDPDGYYFNRDGFDKHGK
jgi:hypothetical protein